MAVHWVKWQSRSLVLCRYCGHVGRTWGNDYYPCGIGFSGCESLAHSPWGVFSIAATIPIALFMGVYMRFIRPGRIAEVSIIGFVLMMLAIVYGGHVAADPYWGEFFTLTGTQLTWCLIIYGFIASVLPVWLLLAPRDYLSTFLKIGVILGLAVGIVIALPDLKMPAVTHFIDGTGPVSQVAYSRSYLLPLPVVPFQVSMRWYRVARHQNLLIMKSISA